MKFVVVFALFALVAGKPTLPSLPQLEAILDAINNRPVAGPAIIDYEPVVVGPDMIDFDLEHESAIAEDTLEGLLRKLRDILERIKPVAHDKIKHLKDKVREILDLLPERPVPVVDDYQTVVIGPALVEQDSTIADVLQRLKQKLRDIIDRISSRPPGPPKPVAADDYQSVIIGPALVDFEVDPESAIANDTLDALLQKIRALIQKLKDRITRPVEIVDAPEDDSAIDSIIIPVPASSTLVQIIVNVK